MWSNCAEFRTRPRYYSSMNEEDPIKNEGARVLPRLNIVFSEAQGQLTPKSAVEFCRNSNSSKLLWLPSLPARMKKIQSKMKALECYQDFPHYKYMGIFSNAHGKLTPQSVIKSCRVSKSSEILWLSSIPARLKKIRSKIKVLEC